MGACAIAAAAALEASPSDVAQAWKLDRVRDVEPKLDVDADDLRADYKRAVQQLA